MDISWRKEMKYNSEMDKKILMNNFTNKNNIFLNNNNVTLTDIPIHKKDIFSKKSGNSHIDSKNNENYQSYHILYLNNPNNIKNSKEQKLRNNKMAHNYHQANSPAQIIINNNKKNEKEFNENNKYKDNINLINNINNNNIFTTKNSNIYISSSQNPNIRSIINKSKTKGEIKINLYENNLENSYINQNNKYKNRINFNIVPKNTRIISNSASQQNIITNNRKLIKTEENINGNMGGYNNNLNNINVSNRNNHTYFISPNKYNNNINNKIISSFNKSNKKEKIIYTYKTSMFENSNINNNSNTSDYINNNNNNNNNFSNINIDLYGTNNASMNNNNYINLYLMNNVNNNNINNNNRLLYCQNNIPNNIPKNIINGNNFMLAKNNNYRTNKLSDNKEILKNIKVNTTAMTRNNIITERNLKNSKKTTNKSLEDSDCCINIKIKNNKNYINKIINRTNDNNMYKNKYNNSKIYIKKIDTKNIRPLICQKDNNIKNNKTPIKNISKRKTTRIKNVKKNNIILEKPKNKNSFKKRFYCYNLKVYGIKKCYFIKTYISKNLVAKNNNIEENNEISFAEKISAIIDTNNINTISINNINNNQIEDPSLIENSFKDNNKPQQETISINDIQTYNNSKAQPKNSMDHPQVPKKDLLKMKKNFEKHCKQKNNSLNFLDKEEFEMTFGIEEIANKNINNEFTSINNNKEESEGEGDLYQNEDIKIMTDDEIDDIKDENNLRITRGKEIVSSVINPEKINKGLELLEKLHEKRKSTKFELSLDSKDNQEKNEIYLNNDGNDNNFELYYKKTNTVKPKDTRIVLKNLTENKKCEILNEILTDLFEKKEKESQIFDTNTKILNYNPIKIEKYEKIFNQEKIQNLESILNKKKNNMFGFMNDKDEIMNEIQTKKSTMTYNKKYTREISNQILEESYNDENSINSEQNKIIYSYEYIMCLNQENHICKKDNILPKEVIEHCNEILNNFENESKKNNNINKNINNNINIERWSRKDLSQEIKKAEEYIVNMNIEMSKNNYKYEIIEILNTITVDNYKEILKKLSNIVYKINDSQKINLDILLDNQFQFSEIIIEKAIMEKGYAKLYAKICYDLYLIYGKLINKFRNNKLKDSENLQSLLISECKQKFNDYQYNKNNINENEYDYLIKKKFLGNINFICELIDVKLFSQKIGFEFLDILFKNYKNNSGTDRFDIKNKNLNLEGAITLLNKFGKIVFEEKIEKFLQDLDYYMKECTIPILNDMNDKNIPGYLKYKIINLKEKQKNNWKESMFEKSILAKGKNNEL